MMYLRTVLLALGFDSLTSAINSSNSFCSAFDPDVRRFKRLHILPVLQFLQLGVLFLEPDGETIRMAPPFSAVPTQHTVRVGNRTYFANCCWDSLGIPAALHAEADVFSRCEQTLEPVHLRVGRDGPVDPEPVVAHFAVPAAKWWADLVHT